MARWEFYLSMHKKLYRIYLDELIDAADEEERGLIRCRWARVVCNLVYSKSS